MSESPSPLLASSYRNAEGRTGGGSATLVVGVADMAVSSHPGAELVTHSLGSCVGIAIYDPVKRTGGLLHVLLPDSSINPEKGAANPAMFVDTGLPRLFHAVYALGGEKWRLCVKLMGGAQFINGSDLFNIGRANVLAVEKLLAKNSVPVHAKDVGGTNSRTVRFKLSDGTVTVQTPGANPYRL